MRDTEAPTAPTLVLHQASAPVGTPAAAAPSRPFSVAAVALFFVSAVALVACMVLSHGQSGIDAVTGSTHAYMAGAAWSKAMAVVAALSGICGAVALLAHLLTDTGKADS